MTTTKANIKDVAVGRSDLFRLKPEDLNVLDGWNSREANDPENAEHIEALAVSIAECGVRQPLTAFQQDGAFYVSDGHCRLAAVNLAISRGAEIKSVPVVLEDRFSTEADRVFSQVVRNGGKPLAPLEQARVFKRLLDLGWTIPDIAAKSGKGKPYITSLLDLQAAPADVVEPVKRGQVSATLASATLKKHGPNAGAVIEKGVAAAAATGAKKATSKHINPKPKKATGGEAFDAAVSAAVVGTDLDSFKAGWDAAAKHFA